MLAQRIISGISLGTAMLAAVFFATPWLAVFVLLGLTALALREYYSLLDAARISNFRIVGTFAGVGLLAVEWFVLRQPAGAPMRQDSEVLSLAVAFGILFVRQFFARENPKPLETLAGTLLGIFYICIPMIFFMRILTAWGGLDGRWVLLYMILVVKITDVGAFFIGCAVGRHKLIPRISPNKSWEGVLGGVVAGVAASVGIWSATGGHIGPLPLRWGDAVALGFLLSVAGVLGDLAESMLKRAAAMKDSGRMIAGMGGLLDVIDSLLPAAPIVYFYVRHIMTHAG